MEGGYMVLTLTVTLRTGGMNTTCTPCTLPEEHVCVAFLV